MMVEYKTTERFRQECIDEILRIEKEKGLSAESILHEAKKESNPLHDFFEWEDSIAANEYRLHQARILINEVKVIVDNKEYFAFENVGIKVYQDGEQVTERIYKPIVEILDNQVLRQQVLASALSQLNYWKEKFSKYQEVKPIVKSIEVVTKKLNKKWQKKKK